MGTLEYLREKYKKQLLSEQEVARELGVTKKEVKLLLEANELAIVNMGNKDMIVLTSLANFLDTKEASVYGQQNHGLKPTEELSSSQIEENTLWIDIQGGDDNLFTGSVTYTKGRYISQITIEKLANGKRKRESKSFKSRGEAEEHLQRRLAELNDTKTKEYIDKFTDTSNKTVNEFTNYYFSLNIGEGTSRTQNGYREDMRVIIEKMGGMYLSEIEDTDINHLFKGLAKKYSQAVLNRKWNTFKMILSYAEEKQYIERSPFRYFKKKPKSRKLKVEDKEKYPTFKELEMNKIIELAKDHNTLYPIFTLLRCTGMRPGELRALMWKNLDIEAKTIKIASAATREYDNVDDINEIADYKEIISTTKSVYGERTLDLTNEAVEALIQWRAYLQNSKNKKMKESKYIFPSREGDFMRESAVRSLLARFIAKYNLQDIGVNLYKFRHTMCTNLILDNISLPVIQYVMGDNTTRVIMEIYTHIRREDVTKATRRYFDKLNMRYENDKEDKAS